MKVIHVAWEAEKYGVSTFLRSLLPCQNEIFPDLKADIVFHATNENNADYIKQGITVYSLGASTAKDISLYVKFYNIFKNYDIVNLHTHSPLAFLAAKFARKKVIYTFHGALGLRGKWSDGVIREFNKYVLANWCDYFTFASKTSFDKYILNFKGIKSEAKKYRILPYGIQLNSVIPGKSSNEVRSLFGWNDRFLIGTAARLEPEKRIDYLIHALNDLKRKQDFLLVIIGGGDHHKNHIYRDYLKNLVQRYQLDSYVKFLGYRKDVYDILNALDLFILPSKQEAFGLALLEAMALGIPSIVFSDGGGTVDILGNSGIIVNSVAELTDTIEILKRDADLRGRLSDSAKERAKLFDISYTAKSFREIYCKLLDKEIP